MIIKWQDEKMKIDDVDVIDNNHVNTHTQRQHQRIIQFLCNRIHPDQKIDQNKSMFSLKESLTKELCKTKANEGRQKRRSCYLWMDSCWVDGCTLARVNIQRANIVASIYHLQVPNQDLPPQHRCNLRTRISWIFNHSAKQEIERQYIPQANCLVSRKSR